jgi:hypothetical protein
VLLVGVPILLAVAAFQFLPWFIILKLMVMPLPSPFF